MTNVPVTILHVTIQSIDNKIGVIDLYLLDGFESLMHSRDILNPMFPEHCSYKFLFCF